MYAIPSSIPYLFLDSPDWGQGFKAYGEHLAGQTAEFLDRQQDPINARLIWEFEAGARVLRLVAASSDKDVPDYVRHQAGREFARAATMVYSVLLDTLDADARVLEARKQSGREDFYTAPLVVNQPESTPNHVQKRIRTMTRAMECLDYREVPRIQEYVALLDRLRKIGFRTPEPRSEV